MREPVEGLEGNDGAADVDVEATAFAGHRDENGGGAVFEDALVDAAAFGAEDEAGAVGECEIGVGDGVGGDFDGDEGVATFDHCEGGFFVCLDVAPADVSVAAHAGDVDLGMRRLGCASCEDDFFGPACVGDAEKSADVVGVVPILEEESEFDLGGVGALGFAHESPDFGFGSNLAHGVRLGF